MAGSFRHVVDDETGEFTMGRIDNLGDAEEALEECFLIIWSAKSLCEKFVGKVESGRARSRETYAECKNFLELLEDKN